MKPTARLPAANLTSTQPPSLAGEGGVSQLHQLQADMRDALSRCDYARVRQLDNTCAVMLDKLIALNNQRPGALLQMMQDVKQLYADLLSECQMRPAQVC
ncbi:hypothetical protein [Gilvimarinus polysaccharolyticus]|uniref:hypothetical protein n=1 Tax=Gilvimarinus polysaccharolyticus TaxID=863921 RepID=UPI000673B7E5|nr:hypothetical protein [Gilvimarinus polysaccharolyticus]